MPRNERLNEYLRERRGVVVEGDSITGSQDVMIVNVPTIMTQHNDHRNEWSIECHDLLLT